MHNVKKRKDSSGDWDMFSKRLKRLLRDAMRLCGRRKSLAVSKYESLRSGIERRLTNVLEESWKNGEAKRLVKRLRRHRQELLVFLYREGVPSDNNHAERMFAMGW